MVRPKEIVEVLKDSELITDCVYAEIREICAEGVSREGIGWICLPSYPRMRAMNCSKSCEQTLRTASNNRKRLLGMLGFKKALRSKELSQHLVVKEGIYLSKVYGVIDRFSEDIDLIIDWGLLGDGKEGDDAWEEKTSASKLDKFSKEFNERAEEYIRDYLFNEVSGLLAECPSVSLEIRESDGQIIDITYPSAFKAESLRPAILLEVGPLASWVPSIKGEITTFTAEEFPEVFEEPKCIVTAITAERTF